MPANLENSAVATGLERSIFIPITKKGNAKECSNYCTIAHISHASIVMLKILHARLQQYVNCELPDVQAGFTKVERQRNQKSNCQHTWDHQKSKMTPRLWQKAKELQKNIYFCFIDYAKAFDCVDPINCGKFFKR